jgi:hypothetical protein
MSTTTTKEPELIDDARALALRNPSTPVSLIDLASRKGEAVEIIDARVQVLETARRAAIRMTHPEDWVLFKTKDDRVTGYLQDAGCERVRAIFGISIFDVKEPEKVTSSDGSSFAIIVRGRGSSGLTQDELEMVEGIRESTEDFCKDLKGIKQELRVRQAARANLDGRVVRELTGLGSVPVEELGRAWQGTEKKIEHCRKGRGFGSQDERLGGAKEGVPDVAPPECPVCKIPLVYRAGKGDRGGFYGCRQYEKHPQQKVIVDAAKWIAEQQQKATASTAAAKADAPAKPATTPKATEQPPLHANDIFGGREPGAEG